MRIFVLLALLGIISSCKGPEIEAAATVTTRGSLGEPRALAIEESSGSTFRVSGRHGDRLAGRAELRVLDGWLDLSAEPDGTLALHALELSLEDLVLTAEDLPPSGVHLTGLHLALASEPVAVRAGWTDGGREAYGQAKIDLMLDWAVGLREGGFSPLATQRLEGISVYLAVRSGARGQLEAEVVGVAEGTVWQWAEAIDLSDLAFDLLLQGAPAALGAAREAAPGSGA